MEWSAIATFIVGGAALLLAIASPVITTIANNCYNATVWKLEYYEKHRAEVIETYLKSIGEYIYSPREEAKIKYAQSLGEIFMYVQQEEMRKAIEAVNSALVTLDNMRTVDNALKAVDKNHNYNAEMMKNQNEAKNTHLLLCQALTPLVRKTNLDPEVRKPNHSNKKRRKNRNPKS